MTGIGTKRAWFIGQAMSVAAGKADVDRLSRHIAFSSDSDIGALVLAELFMPRSGQYAVFQLGVKSDNLP